MARKAKKSRAASLHGWRNAFLWVAWILVSVFLFSLFFEFSDWLDVHTGWSHSPWRPTFIELFVTYVCATGIVTLVGALLNRNRSCWQAPIRYTLVTVLLWIAWPSFWASTTDDATWLLGSVGAPYGIPNLAGIIYSYASMLAAAWFTHRTLPFVRYRRLDPNTCRCGYDLRGITSAVCPECGRDLGGCKTAVASRATPLGLTSKTRAGARVHEKVNV